MANTPERFIIRKSENDDRQYRGIQLTNGLKALLISDQAAKKSAAALAVGVGSSIDHPDGLGEMRLYQRILYLSDHPGQFERSSFRKTMITGGGTFNAETQIEFATYYFDINSNLFSSALSSFADLFKEFDLSEDVIAEEIPHVQRELRDNRFDSKWKTTKFIEWLTYYHATGKSIDIKSMIETTKEEDIKVLSKRIKILLETTQKIIYCRNIMTLCVLGKEDLDSLEHMVVKWFTLETMPIKRSFVHCTLPPSVYKIYYVPHGDYNNKLHIVFHLNYSKYHDYAVQIDRFLAYLFEYDGRGSLLWHLKAQDWGTSIEARTLDEIDKTLYSVCISLTENGVELIDNVMTLFLQYVNMIKNNNLRGVYNDYKEIQEIKFRLKEKEPSLPYVRLNAQAMLEWPMEYVLRGRYVPIEWKQKSVKDALEDFLTPLRMCIYVGSKQYETVTDSESPYYNYKIEEVPTKTYAKWMEANHFTELNLPASNEFIPAKINIKPLHGDEVEMIPQIIKKTEFLTVRHLKDMEFNEPKANMFFHFISQEAYIDYDYANYTFMFANLINKSLSEYVNPAALVDLHWKIFATNKGIEFKISGLDNKQHVVLEKIIDQIMNFELNPKDFEKHQLDHKRTCLKELEKFRKNRSCEQAKYYLSLLLIGRSWDKETILNSYHNVTFEKFKNFISYFTNSMYVEGLIHGNITKAEALDITHIIENKLLQMHVNAVRNMNLVCYRDIKLENEHRFIFCKKNKFGRSSCTLVHYQIAERSMKQDVLLDLTRKIISRFCDTLEEKEQLGDMVYADVYRSNMVQGLTILVQDRDSHIHKIVEEKVDNFMRSVLVHIQDMDVKEFKLIKNLMIETHNAKKPKTLNDLSDAFWNEILKEELIVEKFYVNIEKQKLDKIRLEDLQLFFMKLVDKKTPKLSVYVTSDDDNIRYRNEPGKSIPRNFIKNVNDILEFQTSHILCALKDIEKYQRSFEELDDNN